MALLPGSGAAARRLSLETGLRRAVLASYERCFRAERTNDWAPKTTETQKKTAVPLAEPQRLSAAQRAMLRAAMACSALYSYD